MMPEESGGNSAWVSEVEAMVLCLAQKTRDLTWICCSYFIYMYFFMFVSFQAQGLVPQDCAPVSVLIMHSHAITQTPKGSLVLGDFLNISLAFFCNPKHQVEL